MKKYISIFAMVFFIQIGKAQLSVESIIGNHAGFNNWNKLPVTLELKDNFVYEMTSYNYQLESQSKVKGRWRIEGEKIILTDLIGGETVLQKNKDEFFLEARNGISCMARFSQNKNLKEYWKTFMSASGC